MTRTITSTLPVSELLKGIPGIDPNATASGDTHVEAEATKAENAACVAQEPAKPRSSFFHLFFNPFAKSKANEDNATDTSQADTALEIHRQQVEAIKRVMQGQQQKNKEQSTSQELAQAKAVDKPAQAEAKKHSGVSWLTRWFTADDQSKTATPANNQDKPASPPTTVLLSAPKPIAVNQSKNIAMVVHQQGQANNANVDGQQGRAAINANDAPAAKLIASKSTRVQAPNQTGQANAKGQQKPAVYTEDEIKAFISANHVNEDPWTVRLRYLALNGTTSLKAGEAFVFSEETGEATLFLEHGQSIRRHVLPAQDPEDMEALRRPDIMHPDGVQYNLSLLGKMLPKKSSPKDADSQPASKPAQSWLRQMLPF